MEALGALQDKPVDGKIVVGRIAPKLAKLTFCKKGGPRELFARQYHGILANLEI